MDAQGGRTGLYLGAGGPRRPVRQGVQQDVVLAYMWLSLAATQQPDVEVERDVAASEMTPDEIAEAQRLAREWKPKQAATQSP